MVIFIDVLNVKDKNNLLLSHLLYKRKLYTQYVGSNTVKLQVVGNF